MASPNPLDKPFIGGRYTPPKPVGEGNSAEDYFAKLEAEGEKPVELTPDAPAEAPPPEIPPVEESKVEILPAPETPEPPAEEAAPPEAAEPDEEPEAPAPEGEKQRRRRPSWSMVEQIQGELQREREMRIRSDQDRASRDGRMQQLEVELAQMKGLLQGSRVVSGEEPPPTEPVDPLTALEQGQQNLAQQLEQERAARARMEVENRVRLQEAEFRSKNPDYDKALNHYAQSRMAELRTEGTIDEFADHIMRINPNHVRDVALKIGKSEREAADALAMQTLAEAERDRIVSVNLRKGRNVAEQVYKLAQGRGWKAEAAVEPGSIPAKPAAPKRDPEAVKAASASLSAVPKTTPPPARPEIRTRADLDQFLKTAPIDVGESYIFEMDEKDPHWMAKLG